MKKSFTDNRITARDLQIGDYFYLRPRNGEDYTIVRINSISRRKFGYFLPESKTEQYVRYCEDRLEGIPFHEAYIYNALYTDDKVFESLMRYNILKMTLPSLRLDYIHQLQHVLNAKNPYNKFHLNTDMLIGYGKEEKHKQ